MLYTFYFTEESYFAVVELMLSNLIKMMMKLCTTIYDDSVFNLYYIHSRLSAILSLNASTLCF